MRIKPDYVLQEIAGEYIVVPIAQEADRLNGVIKLNGSGAFLWTIMCERDVDKDELIGEIIEKYEIKKAQAENDVSEFIRTLADLQCLA